jgi:hypothetical protein
MESPYQPNIVKLLQATHSFQYTKLFLEDYSGLDIDEASLSRHTELAFIY